MKLFYSPGACSLSPHIVLREAGVNFSLDRVDHATKTTESGAKYLEITAAEGRASRSASRPKLHWCTSAAR